jgi:YegS/Rv2252/BmrU family lipid kinase
LRGDALLSERPGHLTELAREAAADTDLLVAVGGDGTVHEVVNGIAGLDVELAVIARGTGWDFVRTYGIPRKLEGAVEVALEGRTREIDLGRARYRGWDGRDGEAVFANVASAGMSGAVAKRANETSKAFGGKASYAWATLAVFARWRNDEVIARVDGEEHAGRMLDVIVANGRYLGGGMMMTPEAEPDDGRFDVLLIGDVTKRDLIVTLPKIYRGTHLPHPKATLLHGTRVEVEAPEPLPVELDGEQPGTTPVSFEVLPRALRLRVPA